ncbi:MAG: DUF1214 domain-containing protein [Myxococcales bacterium]|nr:DUF1214 domain-containing protein [Myxococcales bacterium]MDH3483736.1 DUF1214 domain-containing protein [Myxococcales bacterium]
MSDEMTQSQALFNRFAGQLKAIGDKIVGPTGAKGPRERAEGFRYLIALMAAAQELEMEVDRTRPRLTRMFTPMRSFIADGTDTLYHEAKLDESHSYELTVRRGDDLFLSIVVYASDDDGMREMVSFLIDQDIAFETEEGNQAATIHISSERPKGAKNWLELKGQRPFVLTRQYFPESVIEVDDGRYREATMSIQCLDDVPGPDAYGPDDLASGLERIVTFMHDTVDAALGISAFVALNMIEYDQDVAQPTRIGADGSLIPDEERHDEYTPEELVDMVDPKVVANNLPGPGIGYVGASFKLADDEAILIEGKDVSCRYWSCQLFNHFLQSGDYRYHTVSLNNRQVRFDDDGSFRIYASRENPGVENWLDTEGRRRGQVVLRTLLAETDMNPTLSVIKIADIPKGELPP